MRDLIDFPPQGGLQPPILALLCSCSSIIVVHNHPSGNPEPSFEDKAVMGRLNYDLSLIEKFPYFAVGEHHHTTPRTFP